MKDREIPAASTVILWIIVIALLVGLGYGVSLLRITGSCQADIFFNMDKQLAETAKNVAPALRGR